MDSTKKRYVIGKKPQRTHKYSNYRSFYRKFFGTLLVTGLVFPTASAKPANPCKETQQWFEKADGAPECVDCQPCPPGQTVLPECGNSKPLPPDTMGGCVPCELGKSFSNEHGTSVCSPCSSCAKDQVVIKNCSRQADIQCGNKCYSKDRYYDKSIGDCLKCSKCCHDDRDVVEGECKEKLESQSSMICSFHSSVNRCDIKSTVDLHQPTTESSQSSAHTTSSHTVTVAFVSTNARATRGYRLENISQPEVQRFASKSKDHSDSHTSFVVTMVLLVLVIVCGIYLLWFCKSRSPIRSRINPDGGTYKKKRTEVHYNSGSAQVELFEPLLESDGKACPSLSQNEGQLVTESDSKPLGDLLDSSEMEEICDLLDVPIRGKLSYEAIARYYGASYIQTKAWFQDGKSKEVIAWLVTKKPELTVKEFAIVAGEKAERADVADKLKAFDLMQIKATKEATDV